MDSHKQLITNLSSKILTIEEMMITNESGRKDMLLLDIV